MLPVPMARTLGAVLALALFGPKTIAQEQPAATSKPAVAGTLAPAAKTLRYHLQVRLQEDGRTIDGTCRLTWRNPTEQATSELRFHVYNNAWADWNSVWLRQARMFESQPRRPRAWGETTLHRVRLIESGATEGKTQGEEDPEDAGQELPWHYLAQPPAPGPGPGGPMDRTVAQLTLPQPVAGGDRITVEWEFTTVMPPAFRRSGSDGRGGYLHAVQWYPKLGVFEVPEGGGPAHWNCLPYHYLTEFYADFADFQVELTLPERYLGKVGATGSLLSDPERQADGGWLHRFSATNVHDFAWTADPDFLVFQRSFQARDHRDQTEEEKVAKALGKHPSEVVPGSTQMILLLQPEHREYRERYFHAMAKTIYYYGLWYGPYPYETITLVDPASDARATGGMEYPRLVTGGVYKGNPERWLQPEGITVHEVGHQFWYGMVANDEFHHAWLDEGFNSYSTHRVLDKAWPPQRQTYDVWEHRRYGRRPAPAPAFAGNDARSFLSLESLPWPAVDPWLPSGQLALRHHGSLEVFLAELPFLTYYPEVERHAFYGLRSSFDFHWNDPLAKPSYQVLGWEMRTVNGYRRPALMLESLARLMGEEAWIRTLRDFYQSWRFGHPRPADFAQTLQIHGEGLGLRASHEAFLPLDWSSLWNQLYFENAGLDFAVKRLLNQPSVTDAKKIDGFADPETGPWDVTVEVIRLGDFRAPVQVEILWQDGQREWHLWDGQTNWWRFHQENSPRRVQQVIVDPQRQWLLDRNWLNNSLRDRPERKRSRATGLRTLLWAQQIVHYFGGLG
ncbi:MAG: M1 family peptidase [Planctomycetota bacterium]|nr:MAG: M1 family peptidase [Planctomycetota bacterium]